MGRAERRFERYRRKGDLDALGAVFDELAPGLLRVAMHVAPDPAAAEDLLQETFLSAIAHASRFDGSRALRPWLAGILRNHARQGWRRRARDEAGSLPEMTARRSDDPANDVGWSQTLSEHVEQVDAPMRQVLVLRLKHDMAPADIAELLDVAPATVRTRLHRGLAKLRDRLPPESAPAALLALPTPVGLPVIRTQVLHAASQAVAITTATGAAAVTVPLIGGLVVTKKTLAIAAAATLPVLAVGGAWLAGAFDPPVVPHEERPTRTISGTPSEPAKPTLEVAEEPPKPKREAPVPARKPKPEAASKAGVPLDAAIPADKGSVAGVVRFDDGAPLRGARVALWGSPNVFATTDNEGRFHIHADWVADRALFLPKEGKYKMIIAPTRMRAGKRVDVEVTLVRGIEMAAQVVDAETNKPLRDTKVTLRRPERNTQASAVFATTDAEGRFHLEYLPRVLYTLELERAGYRATASELDLRSGPAPKRFTMETAKRLTIALSGVPDAAKGTEVRWHLTAMGGPVSTNGKSKISVDGHMAIDGPDPGRYVLTIFKTKTMPRVYEMIEIKSGQERLDIALPAFGRIAGSLRDRAGDPIGGVRIQVGQQMAQTGDDGRFEIPQAASGKHGVWLFAKTSSWRLADTEVRADEEHRLDLVLRGGSSVSVRVLREGAPVGRRGATVTLLNADTGAVVASGRPKEAGRIVIPRIERGTYQVEIKSRGAMPKLLKAEIGIEHDLDLGDVALATLASVPVKLVLPEGLSFRDVQLAGLLDKLPDPRSRRRMLGGRLAQSSDGSVAIVGLTPGTHRFRATAKGCAPVEFEVTVPHASKEPLEIRLERKE